MPAASEPLALVLLLSLALPSFAKPIDQGDLNRVILPDLIKQLDGPNKSEALYALNALGPYAKPAAPALARHLNTANQDEREQIASMLVRIGAYQDRAVPILSSMLRSTQPAVAEIAFDALAEAKKASLPAVPQMFAMLKAKKIRSYDEGKAMTARGPLAEAALPYYRSMIELDDDTSPAHGFRMANLIAPNDPAAMTTVSIQMRRGSLDRRCGLARAYFDAGKAVPTDIASACEEAGLGQDSQEELQERWFSGIRSPVPAPKRTAENHPAIKIRLAVTKTEYFAGEAIKVTPELANDADHAIVGANPRFLGGRSMRIFDFFNLGPDVQTSTGAAVTYPGAPLSSAISNMLMNGFVSAPPGSSDSLGKPATVFIRSPGKYRLVIPETDTHVGTSTGPVVTVSADPVHLTIDPPTEQFISATLSEAESDLGSSDAMTRGRAAEQLRNLPDARVVPLLVRTLEDDSKNALEPAIRGLLEYPAPKVVAREIYRAIDEGRPTTPSAMRFYADILARTESGWPGEDLRSALRVEAEAERWDLLLEYRQKQIIGKRNLTPKETVKAFSDGFLKPNPKACATAFQEVLAHHDDPYKFGSGISVIEKCGSKKFIPELWKLAHSPGFDREYAYAKLMELGETGWISDVLADMALDKPTMSPNTNQVYMAALKERPADVAKILDKKLLSGSHEQADFAWRLLNSMAPYMPPPYLPLDWPRIRTFLLAAKPLDENVCLGVADYFVWHSPQEARDLALGVLEQRKQQGKPLNSSVARIFALLPAALGSHLVRSALQAKDPAEAAAMAEGLSMATTSMQFSANPQKPFANPTLIGYFPNLLAYFRKSSDPNGHRSAALAMKGISGLPEYPPYSFDPVSERRWVAAWEDWARQNKLTQ